MLIKTEIKIAGLPVWIELEHDHQQETPEVSKRLAEEAFKTIVAIVKESK